MRLPKRINCHCGAATINTPSAGIVEEVLFGVGQLQDNSVVLSKGLDVGIKHERYAWRYV